jgi:hypothetical protein
VNPRTRRVALYAIGAIAIGASENALAHSYAGLYEWAVHHQLTGWQATSWPAAGRHCHLSVRGLSGRTAQPAGSGPAAAPAWAPVPQ